MVKLLVLDISKYQGAINFKKLKSLVDGIIIRMGYRGYGSAGTLVTDPYFKTYVKGCVDNGIPFGLYFYSQAINASEGRAEADYTLDAIEALGYKPAFPIYIDTEMANDGKGRADVISKAERTSAVKAFCDRVEERGYFSGVYASTSWFYSKLNDGELFKYAHWVAHYAPKCGYTGPYGMWQFTSTRTIDGINGPVDHNYCYVDYPTIIKSAGLNGFNKAEVKPVSKSVDEIAKEVLNGEWGNGENRKVALAKAGYDYQAVQAKVNELLKLKDVNEIAREVLAGKWGNGTTRKAKLKKAGYDYEEIQAIVNKLI